MSHSRYEPVELGWCAFDNPLQPLNLSVSASSGEVLTKPSKKQDFGGVLAQSVDSEGASCSTILPDVLSLETTLTLRRSSALSGIAPSVAQLGGRLRRAAGVTCRPESVSRFNRCRSVRISEACW
jgi:hypothetical protein